MLRAPVKAGEIEAKSQKKTAFNSKIEGRQFQHAVSASA